MKSDTQETFFPERYRGAWPYSLPHAQRKYGVQDGSVFMCKVVERSGLTHLCLNTQLAIGRCLEPSELTQAGLIVT